MPREIPGYRVESTIYSIEGFAVRPGTRLADGRRVLVKSAAMDFPSVVEIEQLDRELALLRDHADCVGVLAPLARVDDNQNSHLICESFPGQPTHAKVDAGSVREFFRFAAGLLRAIAGYSDRGIVHRGLSPACVLWDMATGAVAITHFVRATSPRLPDLPRSLQNFLSPCSAPEQTGQLNAPVDALSDLYSAGAVLYYALSGQYPFARSDDVAELAHSLVAREPIPLTQWRPDLPEPVARYVSRLLAKNPGERPPSARIALEELFSAQSRIGGIGYASSTAPTPGVPPLLGRERELEELSAAVKRAGAGAPQLVLLEGAAGTGKTRLIEALAEGLSPNELFASGKFEQFRKHRPYNALLGAVESLLDVFLSAPEAELAEWRGRLDTIEPAFLSVLAEQIRQVQAIVGPQPRPQRVGPAETENRFLQAFRALIHVLAERAHPLVLVLDDLQWSDDETLKILSELFFKSRFPFLTLVLAFRPSEPSGGGVERVAELRRLAEPYAPVRIELESLDERDIDALCQHFATPCREAESLSALVRGGARGNPLFALEILKRLVQTGELHWAREGTSGSWRLLTARSERVPASANVVDFIIGRIDALPEPCRKVLTAASCIGHAFVFSELRIATELSAPELMRAIEIVCAEGLVTPEAAAAQKGAEPMRSSSSSKRSVLRYAFFHDRIQQAAYSLCSGDERQRIHLAVGRTRLRSATGSGRSLFPAIEHLNRVQELLSPEEQRQLAEHNLKAGVAAKESVAYLTAIGLFRLALNALSDTRGQRAQRLLFQCHLQLAECLYLNAEFAAAEEAFLVALSSSRTLVDEVEVQRTRLVLYQHMQRYTEAISLGLSTLKKLGVRMPEKPGTVGTLTRLAPVMLRARRAPPEELFERPDHAEQTDRMVLDLLVLLWTPSFWVNQSLNALVVLKLIELTLRLGNTPQAPMAYVCFGILHHVVFKQHERGLSFGRLAYRLVEDGADPFIASRVRFLALTFFGPLERDNRENVLIYERALAKCLESGEHVFAGHTLDGISTSLPIHGFRIPEIERRLGVCESVAERIGSDASRELVRVVRAFCRSLSEHPSAPSASIDERAIRYESYLGVHRLLRMVNCYLWDKDDEVLQLAKALRGNQVVQSNPLHASFYALFSVLAACRSVKSYQRRVARRLTARLARFDSIQNQNFKSMLLLATAEVHRREGRADAALDAYHRAVSESAERGHDLVHALSCERLASLFEARADTASHHEYLAVAAYAYERFGATGKLRQLAQKYPNMRVERSGTGAAASTLRGTELDAEALMRAAYAIAEETRSDRLTENLLRVITTTTGGERGLLLKPNEADWNVVAEWRTNQPRPDLLGGVLVPESVIRYVARTKSSVRLHGSEIDPRFRSDPYFQGGNAPSALCLPLMHRGEVSAVLYLENGLCADVFTDAQQRLATMLGHQAAIAMAIADYHKVQMDALQAKSNPHFLYNALSAIAELVQKDPEKAESAVLKLSKLYRYVLSSSAEQVVTLEQELGIVRDYLVLEQHRFGDKLRVELSVSGPTEKVRLPALILQPLVENSVRHGIARKLGPGCVKVSVSVGNTECTMRVEDDGPGWSGSGRKGGFGVRSVRERLALLYGGEGELTIQKSPSVVAELRIPLDVVSRRGGPASSSRNGGVVAERGGSGERAHENGLSRDGQRLQEGGEA